MKYCDIENCAERTERTCSRCGRALCAAHGRYWTDGSALCVRVADCAEYLARELSECNAESRKLSATLATVADERDAALADRDSWRGVAMANGRDCDTAKTERDSLVAACTRAAALLRDLPNVARGDSALRIESIADELETAVQS